MASVASFHGLLHFQINVKSRRSSFRVRAQSLGDRDSTVLSNESVANGYTLTSKKEENGSPVSGGIIREREDKSGEVKIDEGNGRLRYRQEKKLVKNLASEELEVLWDDGFGEKTIKDYLIEAKKMIKPDGGPPRWFCPVECGQPLTDAPLLLFLPGLDGVGLGLTLHHKALGRAFEVRCLHIPVFDRTPFDGLLKFVEETVRVEHAASPNKPIYLVGDSFGGCLALAVAARNPNIDLVLILANPATSFGRSQLQPFFPILEAIPDELHAVVPYLLSFVMGNPLKMATVDIEYRLPLSVKMEQLSKNLTSLLPSLSILSDIITKSALLWKLKLLKSAAAYTDSRLHAVRAEVLVLASGQDYMLPSEDEAKRLKTSLKNCTVRVFKDNGHTLLMEDGFQLLTVIKGTTKYRRTSRLDRVADFLPPSMSEVKRGFDEIVGLLSFACGAAMYSTLDDGRIVRGLAGVPDKGPVLLVGYHMLMGLEIYPLVEEFLKQKKIMIRGLAHPVLFSSNMQSTSPEFSLSDWIKVMGAIPVTPTNLFKLLSTNSHVVLYPGGAREALHYKGEAYKVFWPDQPEFVRMAARFGATIVPFGTVGEDDIGELVLDYNDLMRIPIINDIVRDTASSATRIRDQSQGEVANQELFIPGILPKLPGRFYYLFGKPIQTKGREDLLQNRDKANELYLEIQSEVKRNIAYLLKKREEDPYRNIVDRTMYRALYSSSEEVPAFET